jgi:hypothetical protein
MKHRHVIAALAAVGVVSAAAGFYYGVAAIDEFERDLRTAGFGR